MPADFFRDDVNDCRVGQHARLHRVRANIVDHGIELSTDKTRAQCQDLRYAERVLRRDRSNRRRAVDTQGRKGLEVSLDAGASAGIRAGDGERFANGFHRG